MGHICDLVNATICASIFIKKLLSVVVYALFVGKKLNLFN